MKKMFTLAMMMMAMTFTANAMSYKTAKNEALFLSDKMAYELNLTSAQYADVYEINLDYLMSVNGRNDAYGTWWKRRNDDLKYVLTAYQYEKYTKHSSFYHPLTTKKGKGTAWMNTNKKSHNLAHNNTKPTNNHHNTGSGHFGNRR